ncbi:hypothetical protein CTKZ_02390 [Cellulomonas algicola]|uniref:Lipoprotein LpqB beta-propeller domain-containing protein n=1 Tax=Cellulomonas algicola TaxID=2071633 RepID=A0A401UVH3_9CELL|nr:hypothetical protein [Cellulomonas algicola]GCD18677.1 hypothetical protein CTKZ_02390 [Cellulomonas algicola]
MDGGVPARRPGPGRRLRAGASLLGVATLLVACATPVEPVASRPTGAARLDGTPFAGLSACGSRPFVAVVRGFTTAGESAEGPGSSPSSDILGVRQDGSVTPVTNDLGSYAFGLADDGATVYASPTPDVAPAARAAPADGVLAIDLATGRRTPVLQATDVGEVAPAPDGSTLALTLPPADVPPDTGTPSPALVDLPAAANPRRLAPPATSRAATVATASRDLTWSPDATRLAFVVTLPDAAQEVRVTDTTSGATTTLHHVDATVALQSLDWSPDGTALLAAEGRAPSASGRSRDRAVEIDATTGRATVVLRGVGGDLAYSAADGSHVTAIDNGGSVPVARTWARDAGGRFVLTASAAIGAAADLVAADRIDIPRCAMR